MSVPTISRDCGSRLASYMEGRRRELVGAVIRSPALERPGAPSASACANAFLDRFAQEIEIGDRDSVDVWVDGEAESVGAPEYARIIALACAAIGNGYARDCGASDEVLAYLTLRSLELEKRFRIDRAKGPQLVDAAKLVGRDEIVTSLLAALEACDAATCEHSRAVGMWCGRIAKAIGLVPDVVRQAVLAGILHDVGKIAVPAAILLKPGPLDAAEWATMRGHARIGATMLERVASLSDLAPFVAAHHERIDGRGYPAGIAGNDIPRLSRIIAVADSFHAMISKRPYRGAMSVPAAIEELRAGSGTQWDPVIVTAMLEIVRPIPREHIAPLRVAR
ncbi:MAG: HD-GYP domain-containing protein [Candidatus Eremiobacteraeota bacterium]|nr:HD-GYP domain-containing protein [Candidatus Eremiobacteraeota bacterium]